MRLRIVPDKSKYILQLYNNEGFKMRVKNYGPYKTVETAIKGAERFIEFFHYDKSILDTEVRGESNGI